MKYNQQDEIEFIVSLEDMGLYLEATIPHRNYDEYVFNRQYINEIINVEVWFNGTGYCLFMGKDNVLITYNDLFTMPREELYKQVKAFLNKNNVRPNNKKDIVD